MKLSYFLAASVFISTNILAAPIFPKPLNVYTSQDGGVYTTSWTAYPLRITQWRVVNGKATSKAQVMEYALFADGKMSDFEGIVSIDCGEPKYSHISASNNDGSQYKSFKDAMLDNTIPREVVSKLSASACR